MDGAALSSDTPEYAQTAAELRDVATAPDGGIVYPMTIQRVTLTAARATPAAEFARFRELNRVTAEDVAPDADDHLSRGNDLARGLIS